MKSLASLAACGVSLSDCTEDRCTKYETCEHKPLAAVLNWGPRQPTLVEILHWAEARPCTEGDDDSPYGPRGDDQKCVDEGGGYEEGYEDEGGGYEEGGDVPEGFHEVDTGDPELDPESGDWEEVLDEPAEEEAPMKKVMKEEEKQQKQTHKEEQKSAKESERTSTQIPRDPSLGPDDYHQFWNRDDWHVKKSREILEQRGANAQSPEEADAVRRLLMNGPRVGGGYEKAGKVEPEEPTKETFMEPEPDRSPIL